MCLFMALASFLFTMNAPGGNASQSSQTNPSSPKGYFSYVLEKDNKPIQRFLKPKDGEILYLFFGQNLYKDETTRYVVVYSSSKTKCVLYAFDGEPNKHSATNYGYGIFENKGGWRINPEDPETGEMFESHGGAFTYERIASVMKIGTEQGPLVSVIWRNRN